jgi:molybdopterin-guanine dinucleotide biosynthesis protein A
LVQGVGALGGLYTALYAANYPYVAVVACDMPFASRELFAFEITLLHELGVDAVIPKTNGGTEPFHAAYRRETCLPHIFAAIQAGERRADAWFRQVNIRYLDPAEILPYDPNQLAFFNINTPNDLIEAEKIAVEQSLESE